MYLRNNTSTGAGVILVLVVTQFLNIGLLVEGKTNTNKLEFLIIVFNEGLRSPKKTYPNDTFQERFWPQGFDQLTQKGMAGQHKLGKYIKKRYSSYLGNSYIRQQVRVESLDKGSCLASAYTFLSGLFPPSSKEMWNKKIPWQPIPVYTTGSRDTDPFSTRCRLLDEIHAASLNTSGIRELNKLHKDLLLQIGRVTGANFSDVSQLDYVVDALNSKKLHDVPVPDWAANLTNIYTRTIYPYYQRVLYNTTDARRLASGRAWNELVRYLSLKQQKLMDDRLKLYILAVDTKLLSNLLIGLNVHTYEMLPYSSTLLIELRNSGPAGYTVSILLRKDSKDPQPFAIPGCSNVCQFNKFKNLTESLRTSNNWFFECNPFNKNIVLKLMRIAMLVVVASSLFLSLIACCIVGCCPNKNRNKKGLPRPKRNSSRRKQIDNYRAGAFPESMPMMNATERVPSDFDD